MKYRTALGTQCHTQPAASAQLVGTIHLLSTLVRTACNGNGDHACYLHHVHLKHAAHAPLHAGTAAALMCMCPLSHTHHTVMIT